MRSEKEDKFYVFGAGSFCTSVIGFCGAENIISIVDNNISKIGNHIKEIEVISYHRFIERYNGELIIISVQWQRDEIIHQLINDGIHNFLAFPTIQSGLFTARTIIDHWNLEEYNQIVTVGNPELSVIIGHLLQNCDVIQYENNTKEMIDTNYEIFLLSDNLNLVEQFDSFVDLWSEIHDEKQHIFDKLSIFKNMYSGRRCFLIGNGPSLSEIDLEKIYEENEISFGLNRIHIIYKNTNWRPDFYFLNDGKEYEYNKEYLGVGNQVNFIKDFIGIEDTKNSGKTFYYKGADENYYPGFPKFSSDITQECYGGRTTMYQMIQFACYMGFSEIYLLGVDFSFGEDGRDAHFSKDYGLGENGKREDYTVGVAFRKEVEHAYISARNYAEFNGIKIYNATRGGYLEVFERVNFDEIFE